jgi:hypothetical protein
MWYYIALVREMYKYAHTHVRVRIGYTKRWKEAITSVRIRRHAPSSRFRFRRRDRNAYVPRPSRRKGERGRARSEGSTPGIGSIARTRTCALARSLARSRGRSRVCARDPLHRVRDYARSLDQGRSLFTPTGDRRDSNLPSIPPHLFPPFSPARPWYLCIPPPVHPFYLSLSLSLSRARARQPSLAMHLIPRKIPPINFRAQVSFFLAQPTATW